MGNQPTDPKHPSFLSVRDLCRLLQVSKTTIFNYIKQGRLPQPKRFSKRTVRWHKEALLPILRDDPKNPEEFKLEDRWANVMENLHRKK